MKTSRVKAREQQWSDLLVEQARKRNGYDQQKGRGVEMKLKETDGRIRPVSTEVYLRFSVVKDIFFCFEGNFQLLSLGHVPPVCLVRKATCLPSRCAGPYWSLLPGTGSSKVRAGPLQR